MENFKKVAIFSYSGEYVILQHLLEMAEIRFIFQNEKMISVFPFLHSNAEGGIKLKVHPDHVIKATEIITSHTKEN
tara:strand:- start:932 stop:1159 length:228 start_codon:yes stop_codon:yes gene_type:complete